jgi:dihydroorotase
MNFLKLMWLQYDNMTDRSVISIADMCGFLYNLLNLKLKLKGWKCGSDRAIDEMNKKISQLTQLTKLDLNLSLVGENTNSMSDSSMVSIA